MNAILIIMYIMYAQWEEQFLIKKMIVHNTNRILEL